MPKTRQEDLEESMAMVLMKMSENCRHIRLGDNAREENAHLRTNLADLTREYSALQQEQIGASR